MRIKEKEKKKLTAQMLKNVGFKSCGYWWIKNNFFISVNLMAQVIRLSKINSFDISTKNNTISLDDIFTLEKLLNKLI